jgi:hypothetical protein
MREGLLEKLHLQLLLPELPLQPRNALLLGGNLAFARRQRRREWRHHRLGQCGRARLWGPAETTRERGFAELGELSRQA